MKVMASKRAAPRVPFGTLVETGLVGAGSLLSDSRRRWHARVLADGSIIEGALQGSIHQVGAALQNAPSCNGWSFWHVEQGEQLVPLDALRQRYLETHFA